jgi:hypothetical protein
MRQCPYCGRECDDSALECPIDRTSLDTSALDTGFKITLSGKISLIAGIMGNGAIVMFCGPMTMLLPGPIFGRKSWAGSGIIVAFCTLIAGLPSALVSFRTCSRWVSITGLLLSVSPWPVLLLLVYLIAALRGL